MSHSFVRFLDDVSQKKKSSDESSFFFLTEPDYFENVLLAFGLS